jgi:hypothetical protein
MIVNLVNVFLHFACQRWSDFAAAGFASQMRCISIELPLEIDQDWPTRREFVIGNGLLKLCVAFVHFGVKRRGVKMFARHSELLDKCEFKISQAFDLRVASRFAESRGTATRDGNRRSAKEYIPNKEILGGI